MSIRRGKLFIISGPSGAGKSTVISKASQNRSDICFSVSVTTRKPRPGEVNGKDYYFVSREDFIQRINEGLLLEYAEYVNNYYGTPADYVNSQLDKGLNLILDIEIQGARQVLSKMPDAVSIFIAPPSMEELRNRLMKRGTDSEEVIAARLQRAREEYAEADFYKYLIINDVADTAAEKLNSIINAENCRFCDFSDVLV